jgi:GNAT superfamily N-acetyltransferase
MRQKQPTERCLVTAPCARTIQGRVVFSGSTWVRPDYRGQGLASILPRISRAYAFTRWYSDITMSMVRRKLVEGGVVRAYGYSRVEYSVHWLGSAKGDLELAVVWMDRDELLTDMERFMARMEAPEMETVAKRA